MAPAHAVWLHSPARSLVGIPTCEALIQLLPGQSYVIYVRALNVGGPSARSESATVHTTGLCPATHSAHSLGPKVATLRQIRGC
jgi:hypothetical protein